MPRKNCLSYAKSASRCLRQFRRGSRTAHRCHIATQASATPSSKAAGDISSVFPSLADNVAPPLPPRFAALKARLIAGHEDRLLASWHELLESLEGEKKIIRARGSALIPEIEYREIDDVQKRTEFRDSLKHRGVGIIRAVVSEREALDWKELLFRYIKTNPGVKGFPADQPTVYELYWSPAQILARAHPNLLRAQAFLMSHWHTADKSTLISTSHPTAYADRLRIRQPGDVSFALGPHIDSGSCERWEEDGYGRGHVYDEIFKGNWQAYDPWESSCRLPVQSDLYNGAGACSVFRMFQGWMSMSETKPGEGTLMVNLLFRKAIAYMLLRPFFQPKKRVDEIEKSEFLRSQNWVLEPEATSLLQGAVPSNCQELNDVLHPHLELGDTMVPVPGVRPGDYVAWHCDTIHAVERLHAGKTDSSVMYIPCCPLTEANARYLVKQREAFWHGAPGPDYPSGEGEGPFRGRLSPDYFMGNVSTEAQRAMGLAKFDSSVRGVAIGEREMLASANSILGFK